MHPDRIGSSDDATQMLREMSADGEALASRIQPPRWFFIVLALAGAAWVASPAIQNQIGRTTTTGMAIIVFAVILVSHQRSTGVEIKRMAPSTRFAYILAIVITLVLYSVSLGIVSLTSPWWVIAPAVAEFVLILIVGRFMHARRVEALRRAA